MKTEPVIEIHFDSHCPLCRREIDWLRRRDTEGRIGTVDIQGPLPDDPDRPPHAILMARLHGRLPDGTWVTGVEVMRRTYEALGFRRLVALSRWPLIRQGLDLGYALFARIRPHLPGRHCTDACEVPPNP